MSLDIAGASVTEESRHCCIEGLGGGDVVGSHLRIWRHSAGLKFHIHTLEAILHLLMSSSSDPSRLCGYQREQKYVFLFSGASMWPSL